MAAASVERSGAKPSLKQDSVSSADISLLRQGERGTKHRMKPTRDRKRTPSKVSGGSQRNLVVGGLSLNIAERSLSKGGNSVHITPRTCALLQVFMANRGKVLTRQVLMEKVWETSYMGDTRTLDVHIHMLRKALGEDSRKPLYLHTVRGVGYRFDIPDA